MEELRGRGPVANAVWYYMHDWKDKVGDQYKALKSFMVSDVGTRNSSYKSLISKAEEYANSLKDTKEEKIKDNTNKNKIKVKSYTYKDKEYIRVGPFNWSFPETLKDVTVKDGDGKAIKNVTYSIFKGKKEERISVSEIKSGKNFYFSIPLGSDVSTIGTIEAKGEYKVKKVVITFLKPGNTSECQNMILTNPSTVKEPLDGKFDYKITLKGNLKVIKVDANNKEVKLGGVGFYIQNKNTGKYVRRNSKGKISYVEKEKATEFVTSNEEKDKGEIFIEGLLVGNYVAYETKNPNYGYEIIKDGVDLKVIVDKTKECNIPNKQKYVKLSGYVWVDKNDGKGSQNNDLYKTDTDLFKDQNDILFNGITVRLKDRTTGETVKETVTSKLDRYTDSVNDGNGEYLFNDVLIEKLQDYYIEFEYDGLTYQNVVSHIDNDRGSKAAEGNSRDEFNANFSSVEGKTKDTGVTKDSNGTEKYNLSYTIDENKVPTTATLINNGQYAITANTDIPKYSIKANFVAGQEEIRYINLGLYERSQPDLKLGKDILNAKVEINGYGHTYEYADIITTDGKYREGDFNVAVEFARKGNKYSRPIYKSDYDYINEKDKSKELSVYITYQLLMSNYSSSLESQVNSIVDYYDHEYTVTKVGRKVDDNGNIQEEFVKDVDYKISNYNGNYNKLVINNNTRLGTNQSERIFIQFKLTREQVQRILRDRGVANDEDLLNNVAEINSYTSYKDGKVYAGIDQNSNPGNCVPGDTKTYEDDTAASPALRLETANARTITGVVFEDEAEGENKAGIMTGQERKGNGEYDVGQEQGIKDVKVTLTEHTKDGQIVQVKEVTTNDNGEFEITGYIPGEYTLTYTWGDNTYTVQNYKGTFYDSQRNQNDKKWYKKDQDIRKSDAIDNYDQEQDAPKGSRLQIDKEIKNVKNNTYGKVTRIQMDSTTPKMEFGVEFEGVYTASNEDLFKYEVKNIDFGIIERAKQNLALTKRVRTFKATLANGYVVSDFTINPDTGELEGEHKGVTYMGPTNATGNGFVRLELDNEIIQGCTVEVGYEIVATNQSELDYTTKDYYQYGIQGTEEQKVTISPKGIIDYLDSNWGFDVNKNPDWQVKSLDELGNLVAETVYNSDSVKDKIILYTEKLKDENLKPENSKSVMLNVSKVLSSSDEISLDNETEIVEVTKTGGSNIQAIPGNYVPGTGPQEDDDSMAETVIVTPNTGDNQNYIVPIVIGVTAFAILGAGIIIIKKKVMK